MKRRWKKKKRLFLGLFLLLILCLLAVTIYFLFFKKIIFLGPNDFDDDGILDNADNCPYNPNPIQEDSDGDGIGNICEHAQGNCGGNAECFCDDTLIGDFTMVVNLRSRDGSVGCPSNGLIFGRATGVIEQFHLNCNTNEIRHSGYPGMSKGIRVINSNNNIFNHEIINCKISGFNGGIYHSGGGPAFTIKDSEVFNNYGGIGTVGSADVVVLHSSIHDNRDYGIGTDETLRVTINDSHIFNNGLGVGFMCQTPWTENLNYVVEDLHSVNNNIIENNNEVGLSLGTCSHSTFENNIIRFNTKGAFFSLARPIYRIWVNENEVREIGYGKDRTNNNVFKNNTIYENTQQDLNFQ